MALVSANEAAEILGMTKRSITRKCQAGDFATAQAIGNIWVLEKEEVLTHKAMQSMQGKKRGPKPKQPE